MVLIDDIDICFVSHQQGCANPTTSFDRADLCHWTSWRGRMAFLLRRTLRQGDVRRRLIISSIPV